MISPLNPDSKISQIGSLTVVDTGMNYKVYDDLFRNRYFIYCGHKETNNLKSVENVSILTKSLGAVNPIYLICAGCEGYLIADDFQASPNISQSIFEGKAHRKNRTETVYYLGNIGYTQVNEDFSNWLELNYIYSGEIGSIAKDHYWLPKAPTDYNIYLESELRKQFESSK